MIMVEELPRNYLSLIDKEGSGVGAHHWVAGAGLSLRPALDPVKARRLRV